MNFVVLRPEEVAHAPENQAQVTATVIGSRARYLYETHQLRAGVTVSGGILGGARGKLTVLAASPAELQGRGVFDQPPLPRTATHVVVGVSRPQTVKKVLHTCAMMGVATVSFVRSELGEKSYLHSHALEPQEIEDEIFRGLEQSGDTIAPSVQIFDRFKPFVQDYLPQNLITPETIAILGSTDSHDSAAPESVRIEGGVATPVVLCIGPEAGWSAFEESLFLEQGFKRVFLGPRTLRVETALTVFLGQIELLRGAQR